MVVYSYQHHFVFLSNVSFLHWDRIVSCVVFLQTLLRLWSSGSSVVLAWMILALRQSSVDEDVPGTTGAPFLDLRPDLPHYAGPQTGLQDPLELVPHLPSCLDV